MTQFVSTEPATEPRWGVVATVREPSVLVIGFACHHLALGASRVHLFFDVPDDPAARIAATIPGVDVTLCDAAYWQAAGFTKPPALQTKRQTVNANRVMADSDLDWLLHADADELLWLPGTLSDELADVPEGAWLHIPNLERCWIGEISGDIYGGVFRAPLHDAPDLAQTVYGKRNAALSGGMGGYSAGKAMVRVGDGFLAIHKLREAEGAMVRPSTPAPGARILHFDGITPAHWSLKNMRYATQGPAMNQLLNAQRMASIGAILQAPNPERAGARVYEALYRLTRDEAAQLRTAGALYDPQVDVAASVAQIAPHLTPDYSMAAFDRLHQAELSARAQSIVRQKRQARRNG
ncbi:MAG: glycosyltransferase family 2 protein [Pseudomonadota bacterium]|nr:glycosyltransferase family 2 protein [Pseudomonadota bacterium]